MKISVIGGTGYAGLAITKEALKRGYDVISFSRTKPAKEISGVQYVSGSAFNEADLTKVINGSDVVITALSPRGELVGKIGEVYEKVAELADKAGARLLVVGGFGTLRPASGQPRFVDGDQFPKEYAPEAKELANFYEWLTTQAPKSLDWNYISPAATFGAYNPGIAKNSYRKGGEIALFDEQGNSEISGDDFGLAVVDQAAEPTEHHTIISFAY